tara:strand:- start:5549 stop:5845 length:297 start_codon:yes stop_codon:yes gene_type:complete
MLLAIVTVLPGALITTHFPFGIVALDVRVTLPVAEYTISAASEAISRAPEIFAVARVASVPIRLRAGDDAAIAYPPTVLLSQDPDERVFAKVNRLNEQ